MTRISDVRPYIGAKVEFLRYFKKKNDNELCLSTIPIKCADMGRSYTCRELFISSLYSVIYRSKTNSKVDSNPYVIMPKASVEIKGKVRPLKGQVGLYSSGVNQYRFMKDNIDLISKTLDYILGITNVCLSRGEDEVIRRKAGEGKAGDVESHKHGTDRRYNDEYMELIYKTPSPFWITSPILTSFIMGLTRNCMAIPMGLGKNQMKDLLFDNISYTEIKKIINNTDYKSAQAVYYEVLEPFFNTTEVKNSPGIYLTFPNMRHALKKLIDDGFDSVFRPESMRNQWGKYTKYYGFSRFCSYINNPRSVLGYENYRRT